MICCNNCTKRNRARPKSGRFCLRTCISDLTLIGKRHVHVVQVQVFQVQVIGAYPSFTITPRSKAGEAVVPPVRLSLRMKLFETAWIL